MIDGDGMISIRKMIKEGTGSDTYVIFCGVSNCYLPLLEELKAKFGGRVRVSVRKRANPKWKPEGNWTIVSKDAVRFIEKISPYLIIKNKQAMLALSFWKHKKPWHGTNAKKPAGFIEECRRFHSQMLKLNQRGVL